MFSTAGLGGQVEYSIDSENSENPEKFSLDSSTGWLRNIVKLDREQQDV